MSLDFMIVAEALDCDAFLNMKSTLMDKIFATSLTKVQYKSTSAQIIASKMTSWFNTSLKQFNKQKNVVNWQL